MKDGRGPAFEARGLSKAFGGTFAVEGCDMTVPRGTVYGFLGPNGAGKTTVLKLALGLLAPTGGSARTLGLELPANRDEVLARTGSAIEAPVFYDHLSGADNLRLHLEYRGLPGADPAEALALVALDPSDPKPVGRYSMGMRQRLAIARALSHGPELLVLDEPLNGLDPLGVRRMRDLFRRLPREKGMTVLVSSHILGEIEQVADIVAVIRAGTILREVPLESLKAERPGNLEDFFFEILAEGGEAC